MKFFFSLFFVVCTTSLFALQTSPYKTIILGSLLTPQDALAVKQSVESWAGQNTQIESLQNQEHFYFVSRASGSYWIVAVEPIQDEVILKKLFKILKSKYKDAFVSNIRSSELIATYNKQLNETPQNKDKESLLDEDTSIPENIVKIKVEEDTPDVTYAHVKDATSYLTIIEMGMGILVLVILVIVLFLRQRKSEKNVKEFESLLNDLSHSNSELEHVNKEYQGSIKEQEDFIEEMSEKLKDPAQSIVGRTEKILETKLSDKQSIELRNIQDSGQVVFAIVDDLLDFMKIRSNKLKINVKPFNINELLDLIVQSVLDRIEKKDVEVIFDIEKSVPPRIIGDPIRIGQVLTNLLENGIKFTHAGEVKLHVKAITKTEEAIQLMFEIVDTGIGIPESKLDDIFTPFYQINNNNSAGLGLSISKALVEMMGGEILVSTELNRGSTFTFVLGLKEVDVKEKRHYRLPDSAYKVRRILILDYHDSAATAMKKLLEYFNNNVDILTQDALEFMMPDLTQYEMVFVSEKLLSFEMIKQIDHLKAGSDVKIVIVGSMLHKINNSNLVNKLSNARLMKPVNQQNIFDLLVSFYGDEEVKPLPSEEEEKPEPVTSMPRIVIARTQKQDIHKDDFKVFAGATILVAEDNVINQKVLTSLLKESGINVELADNGQIALNMAHTKHYDLVLMDMNMPVMDGYEATANLKASKETAELPIVALSGETMPDEIAKMQASGLDDRLEKPIKVQALYSVFSKYLEVHVVKEQEHSGLPDKLYLFEDALERCGGDRELYKELVEEFIKLYKNSDELLYQYYEQKNSEKLKELSLDIKGVSANIGAYALANAAQIINESSISSTSMPKHLKAYRDILNRSVDALETKVTSF